MKPLVLALATAWLVFGLAACGGSSARSAGPAPKVSLTSKRVGFIGLPPEAARPSTPKNGKLIIAYYGDAPAKIIWTSRTWGRNFAWVYADGRLIWVREDDRPYGANHISTGFLEQRLTPEGVELLRSEVMATGVLGPRPTVGSKPAGHSTIQVRDGGRLLGAVIGQVSPRDDRELAALFTDPASWLPASAWEDREIRAYVPSRFQVCYGARPKAIERSRLLTLMPTPAATLLRPRSAVRRGVDYCSAMTTDDARALAEALADGGLKRSPGAQILGYGFEVPGPKVIDPAFPDDGPVPNTVSISFAPYLPHGEAIGCTTCG